MFFAARGAGTAVQRKEIGFLLHNIQKKKKHSRCNEDLITKSKTYTAFGRHTDVFVMLKSDGFLK